MTVRKLSDQGFDDFRKERKRMQAKLGNASAPQGYENQALRALEIAEANEAREHRLTREVHDFFAAATRQAASIVEKVAHDAKEATGARVEQEMEAFLIDSLARMNAFILTVLRERRGPVAETRMEPSVGNIVGRSLDEFRWAGTAEIEDKHIGQDPFETPVDDVRREFRQQVGAASGEPAADPVSMEQHLVASVGSETDVPAAPAPEASGSSADDGALPPPPSPVTRTTAAVAIAPASAPTPATGADERPPSVTPACSGGSDLERFKEALKTLVRQGTMTRAEARAAWLTRMQAGGAAR